MKRFTFGFFMIACIIFALAGISSREASAYKIKIEVEKTGPYAEKMGDEMFALAKKAAERDIKRGLKSKHDIYAPTYFVGMDVTKKDTFTICKPYVLWCDSESYSLYPIYYFPVVVKGKIVALIDVYGRIEEPKYVSADIMTSYTKYEEEIECLNKLDYLHKDYAFFLYGGTTMAQGEDGKIEKLFDDADNYREPTDGEEFFYALDYEKKLELTIAQMDDYMTYEELMALHEKHSDPNPIIGGTGSIGEAASASQQTTTTPKKDTSTKENSDNSHIILPIVIVAGVAVVLIVVFITTRIKKRHGR